jgi:hypothetical protein
MQDSLAGASENQASGLLPMTQWTVASLNEVEDELRCWMSLFERR